MLHQIHLWARLSKLGSGFVVDLDPDDEEVHCIEIIRAHDLLAECASTIIDTAIAVYSACQHVEKTLPDLLSAIEHLAATLLPGPFKAPPPRSMRYLIDWSCRLAPRAYTYSFLPVVLNGV